MDELAAKRVLKKIGGLWGRLFEERLDAYENWLRRSCRANETEVTEALEALAEQSIHTPKISEIVDKLRELGVTQEVPRGPAILARSIRRDLAEYVALRERLDPETAPSFPVAVEAHRSQCVENAIGDGDPEGIWNDRIRACDQILEQEGVAAE